MCHFFAICATKILKLLPAVLTPAGVRIPDEDVEFLKTFINLRHHFEHIDERLPGGDKEDWLVRREGDTVAIGLDVDSQGRPLVRGNSVEVTAQGYDRIMSIVAHVIDTSRTTYLSRLRKLYQEHPALVPALDTIGRGLAERVGRPPTPTDASAS
jgi:hypothetical protein